MKPMIFSLFDTLSLTAAIQDKYELELGEVILHQFPDQETYLKISSNVKDRKIIVATHLDKPNPKILPLLIFAETARDLGATEIGLIAPYLPYMRQDKRFTPGEAISSISFARLLSHYFNWMTTIDPHLHRIKTLNEIYTIPTTILHSNDQIAWWIKKHIKNPLIIGPDKESEQWVSNVAKKINMDTPYVIAEKTRKGEREVEVSIPKIESYKNCIPVLIDDIISTGKTMTKTVEQLIELQFKWPVCIAVHALFDQGSYENLLSSGAEKVITCNTISHPSNEIDITGLIVDSIESHL